MLKKILVTVTVFLIAQNGGLGAEPPGEGVAEDTAGQETARGGWSEGEPSPAQKEHLSQEADIELEHVFTYIDLPAVEQREVFGSEEIQQSHAESLVDFLQSEGVQILSYGPYGLEAKPQIRGFTDETVRVVLDGLCVNNAQYGTFDFTSINIGDIERIEIVRGGFTEGVSDEGSVAGTIYITTKKQSLGTKFNSDTMAKTFFNADCPLDCVSGSAVVNSQLGENTFSKLSLRATCAQNNFFYTDDFGKTKSRKNSDVKDLHADVKASHFFGNGSSLTGSVLFYDGKKNCPGTVTQNFSGVQKDVDVISSVSLVNPSFKNRFYIENNAAWIFNRRTYEELSQKSRHLVNTFKYALSSSFKGSDFYSQNVGVSFDAVFLDSTDDGSRTQFSFCVKETSSFLMGSHVTFILPLCVKASGQNATFIPKAGIKFSFDALDFLINGYRMVQFPNMDDMYWQGASARGNPDLKCEEGWGAETTVNWKMFLPFSLCFYVNDYKNKIQWASEDGVLCPKNVASAFYWGIDFLCEKSFLERALVFKFGTEYLHSELRDKKNKLTYKKRIMWTPDWTAFFSMSIFVKNVRAGLEWNYVGKRYKSNLNISYMEPYSLVNVRMSYEGFKHFIPYLRAENIFNTEYEAVDSYPMPGVSVSVGLKTFAGK